MARQVTIDGLAEAVQDILSEYGEQAARTVKEAVAGIAKTGATAVATAAGSAVGGLGKYAKGWTSKVTEQRLGAEAVIYNKTVPGLAHLLEHGHVTRNGTGRVYPRTPAHPHIAAVEEKLQEMLIEEIEIKL